MLLADLQQVHQCGNQKYDIVTIHNYEAHLWMVTLRNWPVDDSGHHVSITRSAISPA
jgi:hypothetical protein